MWDDIRANAVNKDGSARTGAGWVACRCSKDDGKQEKWFNIRTCGSWRMAFLLARLQRAHWDARVMWLKQKITAAGGIEVTVAPSSPGERAPVSSTKEPTTPAATAKSNKDTPLKRSVKPAESTGGPKKLQRVGEPRTKDPVPPKKPFTTPDMIAGSVRLQAILAARKQQ
jgi:hypothetical protein